MSVEVDGDVVRLLGDCRTADAEALCAALVGQPHRQVDVAAATRLHGAVVQALMALRPEIVGETDNHFLRVYVIPLLRAAR